MKTTLTPETLALAAMLLSTLNPQLSTVFAQGTGFTYQGRLVHGDSAANGVYEMSFALYDAVTNGNAVGTPVTVAPLPVTNGLFTTTLDFGAAAFTGANRWVEIGVTVFGSDQPVVTLVPRQPILPVPYALHAANAAGLMSFARAPLDIKINGHRVLRLEANPGESPNLIGGASVNGVTSGVIGATISGGGTSSPGFEATNRVEANYGTISGGLRNTIGSGSRDSTISGGGGNTIQADSGWSTIGGGESNAIESKARYSTISGGGLNKAGGYASVIAGGSLNRVQTNAEHSSIGGGLRNWIAANAMFSTIAGGNANTNSREYGTIGGGDLNRTAGFYATVGGGRLNTSSGGFATVAGGYQNMASEETSTVGGGFSNMAGHESSVVAGGSENIADADNATVGGGSANRSTGDGATVAGGSGNSSTGAGATIGGGGINRASGQSAAIGGGHNNTNSATAGVIAGGGFNLASGDSSVIAGGEGNSVEARYATIGGGMNNSIGTEAEASVIAGGSRNSVGPNAISNFIGGGGGNRIDAATYSAIVSGFDNHLGSYASVISGGRENGILENAEFGAIAGGENNHIADNSSNSAIGGGGGNQVLVNSSHATIPGGRENVATNLAFAAGQRAYAIHQGTFVWADSAEPRFLSVSANEFAVRATGGARVISAIDNDGAPTAGVTLAPGSGTWSSLSDRNAKENFTATNGREILDKVAALPLASWNYKAQEKSIRHLGPTAQDFHAAFGLGESDRTITTVDADGVALAAIQGLNAKLVEELKAKDARIAKLERRLAGIERLLATTTAK